MVEKQKKKSGGAQPNAGRPKGGQNQATIEKNAALKEFKQRAYRNAHRLFNSQFALAQGVNILFKVEYDDKGNKKGKPIIVDDEDEIKSYIDGEFENSKDKYYYMTTMIPDNKAIDSLLDRAFGKAKESIDIETKATNRVVMEIVDTRSNPDTENKENESDERISENERSIITKTEDNSTSGWVEI